MSKPAKDYHTRAKVIVLALLVRVKEVAGPHWKEPDEIQIERLVFNFHHVLNGLSSLAYMFGLAPADQHYHGFLTELQMKTIEVLFGLRQPATTTEEEIADEK